MKFGVIFPQTEFGHDPGVVKAYAQLAESLGYAYVGAYDHVLGANPIRPEGWKGAYTHEAAFLEPFVLFSYMAGVTQKIGFNTGILVLPQRKTAVVAKQAATLDVLSGGRLRLGVGVGWNSVEYVALNENFHNRGKRIEEQIELLRLLWTQPLVTFSGRWHHVPDAGLNPLPIQRPIPIWFGGHSDPVLRRAARIGDGWLPNYRTLAEASPHFEQMEAYLRENGRSREGFGIEVRIHYGEGNPDVWRALQADWRGAGATNCSLNTMGAGFSTPEAHMRAIQRYAEESGLL